MSGLSNTARDELLWAVRQMRAPRLRSMAEFAEQEIVLSTGPFKGLRFNLDRQPFARLAYKEIDSGIWKRIVALGPSQSGKTLCFYVIPNLYHLFEIGETVIDGIPDMEMAGDKWRDDLRPAIEASSFAELMPVKGKGSKDAAKIESVTFRNGATLRFMSGGGSDKKRAGKTGRVLVVTETDGMDLAGETSREADKISQLEVRTNSFGARARTYMECTVSIEAGRTWREYQAGSCSRIAIPCAHCHVYVTPEREHLVGWQDAADVVEAREKSHLCCPTCGGTWTEEQRIESNRRGVLVHKGQEVEAGGVIRGDPPRTDTLGFRWTAANNLLRTMGDEGVDEWKAARDPDEENAEKKQRQFHWALPHVPAEVDVSAISVDAIKASINGQDQGIAPDECKLFAAGIDLGKWLLHYAYLGFDPTGGATTHVIDYGRQEVASNDMAEERAVLLALREVKEKFEQLANPPRVVLIDAAGGEAMVKAAYAFALEVKAAGGRMKIFVSKGYGTGRNPKYRAPTAKGKQVKAIGDGYHVSILEEPKGLPIVHIDDWQWKGYVHARIRTPKLHPGAFFLFKPPDLDAHPGRPNLNHHLAIAKHLTAWKQVERMDDKKGRVVEWVHSIGSKADHWFDAVKLACVGGHMLGVRAVRGEAPPRKRSKPMVIKQADEGSMPGAGPGWMTEIGKGW